MVAITFSEAQSKQSVKMLALFPVAPQLSNVLSLNFCCHRE